MSGPNRTGGRFTPRLPLHDALDRAAQVALLACDGDRDAAARISKSAFEKARRQGDAHGVPAAESLRQRLGLPWPTVITLALTPAAERGLVRGPHVGRPDAAWDPEQALRAVAAAVRRTGSLSAAAYDAEAAALEQARSRRGQQPLGLPSAATITERFGSWQEARRRAGIDARPASGHPTPRPAVETLDEVITTTGLLPGRGQFENWCRAHDIPLGRDVRGWDALVAAVRARRAARGETTPDAPTPTRDWPPLPEPPGGRLARRRVNAYTKEAVLESLRLMDTRHRKPHQRLTEKLYRAACARDPELIPSSCLARHGRFQDLVREAGVA